MESASMQLIKRMGGGAQAVPDGTVRGIVSRPYLENEDGKEIQAPEIQAALQWYLTKLGNNLEVDGQFGNATKTAVVAFQGEYRLNPDAVVGELTKAAKAAVAGLSAADPQNVDADFSYTQYLAWREKEDPMINTLADLSAKAPSLYDEVVALIASGAIKGNGTYPIAKRVSVLQAIVVAGRM